MQPEGGPAGVVARGRKNHALMIKARRENVTEMILEPVTDLHQEDYEIDPKTADAADDAGSEGAVTLEERGKRFFKDASSKVSLPRSAGFSERWLRRKKRICKAPGLGFESDGGAGVRILSDKAATQKPLPMFRRLFLSAAFKGN